VDAPVRRLHRHQTHNRAIASGEVRKDVDPSDLLRAMVGVNYGNPDAGWEAGARRLIDILMDGLRRKDR
jgi:hypothetical protein